MHITVNPRFARLTDFVSSLPQRFESEGETLYAKRNIVKSFRTDDGLELVVKRFKYPNVVQQLGYSTFRPTKARRAYEFGLRLLQLGIETPEPVAYLEERRLGLVFTTGYFVSLSCRWPDCKVLNEPDFPHHAALAEALMRQLVGMHARGVLHGDVNLSNFLYQLAPQPAGSSAPPAAADFRLCVIDTNRSHFHPSLTDEQCMRNLVRLTHNQSLMREFCALYARLRGWDVAATTQTVLSGLHHFEQHKRRARMLSGKGRKR